METGPFSIIRQLLLYLILFYLLLSGLWIVLPCPPHGTLLDGGYRQATLRSGKALKTVHTIESESDRSRLPAKAVTHRPFTLEWQLVHDNVHDSISLLVDSATVYNLTHLAMTAVPFRYLDTNKVQSRAGETDGICSPWVLSTDAILLHWELYHLTQPIRFEVVIAQPGEIQFWPHVRVDPNDGEVSEEKSKDAVVLGWRRISSEPTCTISNILSQDDKTRDLSQIVVSRMSGDVPSKTYPLRYYILQLLAPVVMPVVSFFTGPLFHDLVYIVLAIGVYVSIILLCWVFYGRPPLEPWLKQFRMTKCFFKVRRKRSEKSPEHEQLDDGESQHTGPKPISRFKDVWTSSSPLDDILVTFKTTKWMVQPLFGSRRDADVTLDRRRLGLHQS